MKKKSLMTTCQKDMFTEKYKTHFLMFTNESFNTGQKKKIYKSRFLKNSVVR